MSIEELKEKYMKVSQEVFDSQAVYDAHLAWNTFGRTLEETIDFHKSYAKAKLNLKIKLAEQSAFMGIIKRKAGENILGEVNYE